MKQTQEALVVNAAHAQSQERLSGYLKLGWTIEKIEQMTPAGGGASTNWGAYVIVALRWNGEEEAPHPR